MSGFASFSFELFSGIVGSSQQKTQMAETSIWERMPREILEVLSAKLQLVGQSALLPSSWRTFHG
jgi:hypothetical protein